MNTIITYRHMSSVCVCVRESEREREREREREGGREGETGENPQNLDNMSRPLKKPMRSLLH